MHLLKEGAILQHNSVYAFSNIIWIAVFTGQAIIRMDEGNVRIATTIN